MVGVSISDGVLGLASGTGHEGTRTGDLLPSNHFNHYIAPLPIPPGYINKQMRVDLNQRRYTINSILFFILFFIEFTAAHIWFLLSDTGGGLAGVGAFFIIFPISFLPILIPLIGMIFKRRYCFFRRELKSNVIPVLILQLILVLSHSRCYPADSPSDLQSEGAVLCVSYYEYMASSLRLPMIADRVSVGMTYFYSLVLHFLASLRFVCFVVSSPQK